MKTAWNMIDPIGSTRFTSQTSKPQDKADSHLEYSVGEKKKNSKGFSTDSNPGPPALSTNAQAVWARQAFLWVGASYDILFE